ncbi:MAG TPA: hypothetical protein VK745_21425 [Polyangiaceae bacterium]|jgi:hypothetical protein|nr:hypothetical protein [Polyangiaceae bacterium]
MSISATSNYMSNTDILAWMETKTDGLYGQLRDEMNGADTSSDAEAALDKIKADLANTKTDGNNSAVIHDEVNDALTRYKDVPGVADVLQPIADKLNDQYGTSDPVNVMPGPMSISGAIVSTSINSAYAQAHPNVSLAQEIGPKQFAIASDDVDAWTKNIDGTLTNLGSKDQLSLIDIQEVNSELNQAKQTASALMDAADKSATAIIEHIS